MPLDNPSILIRVTGDSGQLRAELKTATADVNKLGAALRNVDKAQAATRHARLNAQTYTEITVAANKLARAQRTLATEERKYAAQVRKSGTEQAKIRTQAVQQLQAIAKAQRAAAQASYLQQYHQMRNFQNFVRNNAQVTQATKAQTAAQTEQARSTGILSTSFGRLAQRVVLLYGAYHTLQRIGDAVMGTLRHGVVQSVRLQEATQRLNIVLGNEADEIKELSNQSAQLFGQTKASLIETGGEVAHFFRNFGIGRREAAEYSKTLIELARDFASFNNLAGGSQQALEAMRSALIGLPRPARRLGVFVSQLRVENKALELGMQRVNGQFSDAQKFMARYHIILEDSRLASGDFERTAHMLANSFRVLRAHASDLARELGDKLNPFLTSVVGWLNNLFNTELEEAGFRFNRMIGELREELNQLGKSQQEIDIAVYNALADELFRVSENVVPIAEIVQELERLTTLDFSRIRDLHPLMAQQVLNQNVPRLQGNLASAQGRDPSWSILEWENLIPGRVLWDATIYGAREAFNAVTNFFGITDSAKDAQADLNKELEDFSKWLISISPDLDYLSVLLTDTAEDDREFWRQLRETTEALANRKLTDEEWARVMQALDKQMRSNIQTQMEEGRITRALTADRIAAERSTADAFQKRVNALKAAGVEERKAWERILDIDKALRGLPTEISTRINVSYATQLRAPSRTMPRNVNLDQVAGRAGNIRQMALNDIRIDTSGGGGTPMSAFDLGAQERDLGLAIQAYQESLAALAGYDSGAAQELRNLYELAKSDADSQLTALNYLTGAADAQIAVFESAKEAEDKAAADAKEAADEASRQRAEFLANQRRYAQEQNRLQGEAVDQLRQHNRREAEKKLEAARGTLTGVLGSLSTTRDATGTSERERFLATSGGQSLLAQLASAAATQQQYTDAQLGPGSVRNPNFIWNAAEGRGVPIGSPEGRAAVLDDPGSLSDAQRDIAKSLGIIADATQATAANTAGGRRVGFP